MIRWRVGDQVLVHNRGTCCSLVFKAATRELQWDFELGFDGVFEDGDLFLAVLGQYSRLVNVS